MDGYIHIYIDAIEHWTALYTVASLFIYYYLCLILFISLLFYIISLNYYFYFIFSLENCWIYNLYFIHLHSQTSNNAKNKTN